MARTLFDTNGRTLLQVNVSLSEAYIKALRAKGFKRIYVKEPGDEVDVLVDEDVSPIVRSAAFEALSETFDSVENEVRRLQGKSVEDFGKAFSSDSIKALMSDKGPLARVMEAASQILGEVLNQSTLAGLTSLKNAGTQTYDHSIDVCAVSIMIGIVTGMNSTRLRQLATGALLHDIGKVFLPPEIKGKNAVIQHTKLGFELLKNSPDPDIMAPRVAYEHHEHQDGSGFPRGLKGSNTIKRDRNQTTPIPTLIGEITAVANIYDNLLSGTQNRDPLPTDQAILALRKGAGTVLNKEVVTAFLRVVPVYPQGSQIAIRSGEYKGFRGLVVKINQTVLDRPSVALTHDLGGKKIKPVSIDLNKEPDIEIRSRGL